MAEKKIIIDIKEDGEIKAETFGMDGIECFEELNKIMKDLANFERFDEKQDYFKEKISNTPKVKIKAND
jgi:hypothetical protein